MVLFLPSYITHAPNIFLERINPIFSLPYYLILFRPKYSPQHSFLKHPQSTFLPQCERPSFTPLKKQAKIVVLYFYLLSVNIDYWMFIIIIPTYAQTIFSVKLIFKLCWLLQKCKSWKDFSQGVCSQTCSEFCLN